jgi:hypothetical protein
LAGALFGFLIVAIPILLLFLPNSVLAQTSDHPKIEIWPEDSQITEGATSLIRAHICPSPVSDTENITRHSEVGEILYPGTFSISYYGIRPDGTKITIGHNSYDRNMCNLRTGTYFDTPDTYATGNWTIYATVTWASEGEIVSIKSNEISVLVKPSVLQPMEPELLTDNPELDPLLDWSSDGRYILGVANSPEGRMLGLMDVNTLEVTRVQKEFDEIYDARFSSSGGGIVIFAAEKGHEPVQVVYYGLSDNSTMVVAEDPSVLALNSAIWLERQDGDRIIYGEMVSADGKTTGYDIWTVRPDGSNNERLHRFALAEDERMWIYDSNEDKLLIKKTRPLGFPITESEIIVFDVNTKESMTVFGSGDDGGGPRIPRFSPSGDFILYDDGPGYRVPGGPINLRSMDGNLELTLLTGQPSLGTDPTSFVISPDGRFLIAMMAGGSSGSGYAYTKTEFAHPMPEFGSIAALLMAIGIVSAIVVTRRSRQESHKS